METPAVIKKQASVTKRKNRDLTTPPSTPVEMTGRLATAPLSIISTEVAQPHNRVILSSGSPRLPLEGAVCTTNAIPHRVQ